MKTRFIHILLMLFTFAPYSVADELESKIVEMIESRKIDDLKSTVEKIKKKYPSHAITYYVDAFVEENGKTALDKYNIYIEKFPNNKYVSHARYKIAQYYFAQGLYHSSKRTLTEILKSSSRADEALLDDVYYLMIQNLIALEELREADVVLREFLSNFKRSEYYDSAKEDYELLRRNPGEKTFKMVEHSHKSDHSGNDIIYSAKGKYTLQVGAFLNHANAEKRHADLEKLNYNVVIKQKTVGGKLFFIVLVGSFETKEAALEFGANMVQKHGINFRVINKQ